MLIHTSGIKVDHTKDYKQIITLLGILKDRTSAKYSKYLEVIFQLSKTRHPGHEKEITQYIVDHINQSDVVVMNSDTPKNAADYKRATSPATLFTVAIGGNIVSRGVTFDNLLSMFFTRDVKHKIQQDTYIQRARMFGTRGGYLKYFELHIPEHFTSTGRSASCFTNCRSVLFALAEEARYGSKTLELPPLRGRALIMPPWQSTAAR